MPFAALLGMLSMMMVGGANASPPDRELDACGLLSPTEIEAIQGEAPARSKGSQHPEENLVRSQCYWSLATHTRSISLEVTHGTSDAVGQRWNHFFHGEAAPKAGGKTGAPRPVQGLGLEAFWAGNAEVGGLYVRTGDVFLRLAVGGGEDDDERIQRTSALARHILSRLEARASGGR
jgi:hypothetical protein